MAAADAFPAWLNDSLRPIRREKKRGPTTPKVIAASAGAKREPATPVRACSTEIEYRPGNNGIASEPAVMVNAPPMISARLAVRPVHQRAGRRLRDDRPDTSRPP